jgi:hypothetical protein
VLFHVPPLAIVTRPANVFVPVDDEITKFPVAPPPTVVVPVMPRLKPAAVNTVPSPIDKLPPTDKPATVVVDDVPLSIKFPPIDVVPV